MTEEEEEEKEGEEEEKAEEKGEEGAEEGERERECRCREEHNNLVHVCSLANSKERTLYPESQCCQW